MAKRLSLRRTAQDICPASSSGEVSVSVIRTGLLRNRVENCRFPKAGLVDTGGNRDRCVHQSSFRRAITLNLNGVLDMLAGLVIERVQLFGLFSF